jgi:hypothetical protein
MGVLDSNAQRKRRKTAFIPVYEICCVRVFGISVKNYHARAMLASPHLAL